MRVQTVDVILAWLVAEDDGAKTKIQKLLADREESLSNIKATLQGQSAGVGSKVLGLLSDSQNSSKAWMLAWKVSISRQKKCLELWYSFYRL